jgi:IS5 family transposase
MQQVVPWQAQLSTAVAWLQRHGLAEKIFEQVNAHLQRKGFCRRAGTIAGRAIVRAPSSTKNASGTRDPQRR